MNPLRKRGRKREVFHPKPLGNYDGGATDKIPSQLVTSVWLQIQKIHKTKLQKQKTQSGSEWKNLLIRYWIIIELCHILC